MVILTEQAEARRWVLYEVYIEVELGERDSRAEYPLLTQPSQLDEVVGVSPRLERDVAALGVHRVLFEVHGAGDVVVHPGGVLEGAVVVDAEVGRLHLVRRKSEVLQ